MCLECGEDLIPLVINKATGVIHASCQNCSRVATLTKEESDGLHYH
ncbi:hypothetical protein PBI_SHEPARD_75 [Arthrobacter phage Shepard]|nr:hypothetical protein PBI_SHEPARD_75 [Arthrobacter phage Shepard]UYL88284.1 hypothetical protein SEA_LILHUDDY_75 [Arthrobacter phage LilHuddy]